MLSEKPSNRGLPFLCIKREGCRQEEPIVIFACICIKNSKSYIKLKMSLPLGVLGEYWVGRRRGGRKHYVSESLFMLFRTKLL